MYASKCKPSQFSDAHTPRRLRNWEIPRSEFCRSKPTEITDCRRVGFTQIIANDKGHLFSTAKKGGGPWSDYVNTFDLPSKIPGPKTDNPTARTKKQARILKKKFDEFQAELCSQRGKKSSENNFGQTIVCCKCRQVVLGEGGPKAVECECYKLVEEAVDGFKASPKCPTKEKPKPVDKDCPKKITGKEKEKLNQKIVPDLTPENCLPVTNYSPVTNCLPVPANLPVTNF